MSAFCYDPDHRRDAAVADGIDHLPYATRRCSPTVAPTPIRDNPTWLAGRVRRLSARLMELGGEPTRLQVGVADVAALQAEELERRLIERKEER